MFRDDIGGSIIGRITVGVALALLVGGTSPWWLTWLTKGEKTPILPTGVGTVFDPPSNVRETPNGRILCSVQEATVINLQSEVGD